MIHHTLRLKYNQDFGKVPWMYLPNYFSGVRENCEKDFVTGKKRMSFLEFSSRLSSHFIIFEIFYDSKCGQLIIM